MVFTSQYYFDAIQPGTLWPTSQRALPHFVKTLKLLRERLARDDDQARLSDTTAAAVMGIAGHALLTRDVKSAKHHIEGLCKIVGLRGGVATFRDSSKLLLEILRCDMGMALQTGSRPVFFHKPSHQEALPPYPDLTLLLELREPTATSSRYDSAIFLSDMDDDLSRAWKVLSEFCSVINYAIDSGQRISTETFLDTMASVMYRLTDIRFEPGSSDEALRLGLLAFACSVFLQWKHLGLPYSHLTSALRTCLTTTTSLPITPELLLWLLMAGAVSVFNDADDRWLKPMLLANMVLCEIDSWSKMQHLLQSFMWIGLIHDRSAKRMFDSTIASPTIRPLALPSASSSSLWET
ncbi:hypothetical protein CONLIGDRAFT_637397 [Coniochaeta ligniaria NRRL 30616]|uniref:Transcription factor domain-containing protein n=1 Tax=Coniochaeta ligniaria NRRL 30616 TaxID=1408157 RepID=A0A1J7J0Q5_9PEZI|nr:hypothetical protein CONLIGDRAFT_637397 [Coniochaeta ligniaria NRRL 30616]